MNRKSFDAAVCVATVLASLLLGVPVALAGSQTLNPNVPNPTKVNLVFNYSASLDAGTSGYSNNTNAVFSPSTAQWANATPSSTGQTYGINIGKTYSVSALEFVFGRYGDAYIPTTFDLYATSSASGSLFTPANLIANQSTAGMIYSNRSPASDATPFVYQQVRYTLPSAQTVQRFGIKVNSWQTVGNGSDNRAFLLAATANPAAGTLRFDGEIGVFDNTWNPGGTISASNTQGGDITTTPVYVTDDWSSSRWWGGPTGSPATLSVTEHLADSYVLKGLRWAAGQSNWPKTYQVFAANYDGVGNPGAGDWFPVTNVITGAGNQGSLVNFTLNAPFTGNWIRIDATAVTSTIWENTKWQVYGSFAPEPGSLALLGLAGLTLLRRRGLRSVSSRRRGWW